MGLDLVVVDLLFEEPEEAAVGVNRAQSGGAVEDGVGSRRPVEPVDERARRLGYVLDEVRVVQALLGALLDGRYEVDLVEHELETLA